MKKLLFAVIVILMLAVPISALRFDQIRVFTVDDNIVVKTRVSADHRVEGVKVTAYILEQPLRRSDSFDLSFDRSSTLYLGEVVPGYYTIRITVSSKDGEKRTKYRFIEIE